MGTSEFNSNVLHYTIFTAGPANTIGSFILKTVKFTTLLFLNRNFDFQNVKTAVESRMSLVTI